jgi:hypothetical protein
MITGTPIDNGDGSFTFQTDTGEPLVLRGESAERVFRSQQGQAPSAAPVMPSEELVEAAAPGQDMRTADARGGRLPFDPAAIAGFNRQDDARELADVQARTAAAIAPAPARTHGPSSRTA